MPIKKNNNEVYKAFAIDTKITYNDKLYEVVESVNCADCSLANICSNSDMCASDRNDNALSRDERIRIFGECSNDRRPDDKSIVFVEVTEDNSDELSHTIIPLFTDDECIQLRPVTFDLPNGYEIDIEASDLSKGIVRFKRKWLTITQLYELAKDNSYFTNRDAIKDFCNSKIVVLANLMDIARYFNGDWEYHITKEVVGYAIAYYKFVAEPHYSVCEIDNSVYTYYGNPVFKNKADAQYVIDNPNFRDILDEIFKV